MKVGLISLGCPKILDDSEVMIGLAREAGHELTQDPSQAEVLVVNTCAFIDGAKRESIDTILEMAQHKDTGACKTLIVAGCLAERYRDELKKEIPEIDAVHLLVLILAGEDDCLGAGLGSRCNCRHCAQISFIMHCIGELIEPIAK